jgi:hypothetical protein
MGRLPLMPVAAVTAAMPPDERASHAAYSPILRSSSNDASALCLGP